LLFRAKARLLFCLAIKHSILQESLPTVVTANKRKVTLALGKSCGCFVFTRASYQHNLQLTKGLIAHNPLTGQRV
jgi:hypothetical protein